MFTKNQQKFITLFLLIAIGFSLVYIDSSLNRVSSDEKINEFEEKQAYFYAEDATFFHYNKDGLLDYKLVADYAEQGKLNNEVLAKKPMLQYFENKRLLAQIYGDEANVLLDENVINLQNNVNVFYFHTNGSAIKIATDYLVANSKDKIITTKALVNIIQGLGRTSAIGLNADLNRGLVILEKDVETRYEVQ